MVIYEVSNPFSNNITVRTGPGVIFGKIDALSSGKKGKGDFIYTYQTQLIVEGQVRASVDDQWIHLVELDGVPADGWVAIKHLGRSYAAIQQLPDPADLMVTFGVDLQGYNPVTLTGILTKK